MSFDDAAALPVSIGTIATPLYIKHEKVQSAKLIAPWEDGGKTLYAGKPAVVLGGASNVGQCGTSSSHSLINMFLSSDIHSDDLPSSPVSQALRLLAHHHDRFHAQQRAGKVLWRDPRRRSRPPTSGSRI